MNAIVTGSRKYGKPRPGSDTDLAILVDEEDAKILLENFGTASQVAFRQTDYNMSGSFSLRAGNLNLLVCTSERAFSEWVLGTKVLASRKEKSGPREKSEAIAVFDTLREMI